MMLRMMVAFICMVTYVSGASAQSGGQWEQSGGWTVRYNDAPEFWRLYHSRDTDLKHTIVLVWADRRSDVSMAQAFEETKVRRGDIDNCPALVTADTRPEYDPYERAMLAVTKIKDPDAYASMSKDIPVIGYEVADDELNPQCALIARDFVDGAMLYAFVSDETGALSTKLSKVRGAVHMLMDDINEKAAPAATSSPVVQSSTQAEDSMACEGARKYGDWGYDWSTKSAGVYVLKPQFLDVVKMQGKKAQLSVSLGGQVDAMKGREDPYLNITIAAEENGQGIIPQKISLSVDGETVQQWGKGGRQWTVLSDGAIQSLLSGTSAELSTVELGRIRFDLDGLEHVLRLADIAQHKAVIKTRLGECNP